MRDSMSAWHRSPRWPWPRARSVEVRGEERQGETGGSLVRSMSVDAGRIVAEAGLCLLAERGAGGEERVVSGSGKKDQAAARNVRGEILGVRGHRLDRIRRACHDFHRDGD